MRRDPPVDRERLRQAEHRDDGAVAGRPSRSVSPDQETGGVAIEVVLEKGGAFVHFPREIRSRATRREVDRHRADVEDAALVRNAAGLIQRARVQSVIASKRDAAEGADRATLRGSRGRGEKGQGRRRQRQPSPSDASAQKRAGTHGIPQTTRPRSRERSLEAGIDRRNRHVPPA